VPHQRDDAEQHRRRAKHNPRIQRGLHTEKAAPHTLWACGTSQVISALSFFSVSEKRGMQEFAYLSIGGPCTEPGYIPYAASQYSLRDFHRNIMPNPHAATLDRLVLA
jgi:hypothetical protein